MHDSPGNYIALLGILVTVIGAWADGRNQRKKQHLDNLLRMNALELKLDPLYTWWMTRAAKYEEYRQKNGGMS